MRHHWFVVSFVVISAIILTVVGVFLADLPDFSDPRKVKEKKHVEFHFQLFFQGWGARGKGTIFSQLMVLRHASERFRLAYELPLETYELFEALDQFSEVAVEKLDENTYRSDFLDRYDLWRKTNDSNQFYDYQEINETFYDTDRNDYDETPSSALIYQWHRDRHFDLENRITKYVDDKM